MWRHEHITAYSCAQQIFSNYENNGNDAKACTYGEIDGMPIDSFLGEQRNSGKPRIMKSDDSKLEKEWKLVEYLSIDEMSMAGLTLLPKANRIICSAKHNDLCMIHRYTPTIHYRPKKTVNYLLRKKFNSMSHVL